MISIILVVVGVALVLWGADRLTDGATALAQRMNVSQIVIGLTVVAMGTSMPEFFVSMVSAIKGTPDLAVGNVVGSNIFNTMFIVGISAAVAPMAISRSAVRKDIPFAVVATLMLSVMCMDGNISRTDAGILFALFIVFMVYTLRLARKGAVDVEEKKKEDLSVVMSSVFIIVGLACLIGGSNLFVNGASAIAKALNVSDAVIGLTVVAMGTSLPELATSVVAARKGRSAMAMGNVIGSNVFNILMILGVTGMITPMQIEGITMTDMGVMLVGMVLMWMFSYTKYKVARWEGFVLAAMFVGYMAWLVSNI
ncbi:MAG: calcium/sodium antiporter [Prevotella sp.]|nr:calcium/sodium antiporter [Prevotella sp.]